eukprot:scaffold3862_cov69-Attheya_sp.AAC.1
MSILVASLESVKLRVRAPSSCIRESRCVYARRVGILEESNVNANEIVGFVGDGGHPHLLAGHVDGGPDIENTQGNSHTLRVLSSLALIALVPSAKTAQQ